RADVRPAAGWMGNAVSRGLSDRTVWIAQPAADRATRPRSVFSAANHAQRSRLPPLRDLHRALQRRNDACADRPRRRVPEHGLTEKKAARTTLILSHGSLEQPEVVERESHAELNPVHIVCPRGGLQRGRNQLIVDGPQPVLHAPLG